MPADLAGLHASLRRHGHQASLHSYNNPKGNADTERLLRTLKEELVWLREWTSQGVFFTALDRWLIDYNTS